MDFGGSPSGGPSLTFDFPADLTQHAQNYRDAVVTNLFYTNNAFHDLMHHYGFNEPSGNFQANNYNRGGTQGDYVRAEAADGAGTNNANFSTPVETATSGGTPRMQMFLWPGNQFGAQNQVVVDGGSSYDATWARFSPAPTVAGTSGQIVTQSRNLADDGRERGNSATLGIENATGTVALQYSFNQPVLDVEPAVTSIRYRPPA